MPVAPIPCDRIDWNSFHDVFAEVLGFPPDYGLNMAAWNDCLGYADDPTAGMVAREFIVDPRDVLTLKLEKVTEFANRCPEQFAAVVERAAFVNWSRMEAGERPILALSFNLTVP